MALALRYQKLRKPLFILARGASTEKSIYERHEEGPQPKLVHGKPYPEWRKHWSQRKGEWTSKLNIFVEKSPSPHILNSLQQIPDLTWKDVKSWWARMRVVQQIQNQKYLPERVSKLGSNLAALHFFTYRLCKLRLKGQQSWISGFDDNLKLPVVFKEGYYVEAIDCSDFHHDGIRYEGLKNLQGLNLLKWLSLKNNKHIDQWCLDRIAGQNGKSLEYLNIEGCKLCTGCIFAIAKMNALKVLVITDPEDNLEVQSALSLLEQERPNLLIKAENSLNTKNLVSQEI